MEPFFSEVFKADIQRGGKKRTMMGTLPFIAFFSPSVLAPKQADPRQRSASTARGLCKGQSEQLFPLFASLSWSSQRSKEEKKKKHFQPHPMFWGQTWRSCWTTSLPPTHRISWTLITGSNKAPSRHSQHCRPPVQPYEPGRAWLAGDLPELAKKIPKKSKKNGGSGSPGKQWPCNSSRRITSARHRP